MKRRDLLLVGSSTAVAHTLTSFAACGAQSKQRSTQDQLRASQATQARHEQQATRVAPQAMLWREESRVALRKTAAACVEAGQACLSHCLALLAKGDTSMAECAGASREMLIICHAGATLAGTASKQLPAMAALCASVCEVCIAACKPHATHHAECKACLETCQATLAAARALAA